MRHHQETFREWLDVLDRRGDRDLARFARQMLLPRSTMPFAGKRLASVETLCLDRGARPRPLGFFEAMLQHRAIANEGDP